ncbi:MAG: GntR family transcriptional regulator [Paracoccaceae bacterium]|nr:MAG: GntR family transcriptional regulator [Paracoccaceae bacterium]
MTGAPSKETLSSRIAADLRDAILRGDPPPGAKINLDRLRLAHGVSISPLREAVARLVGDGLVTFEDQRGYRVSPVSAADLAEVTRLRAELEVLALGASIVAGDLDWESDVMRALYRLNRTERHTEHRQTQEAWEAAHAAFHMALIRGCGMPMLLRLCTTLHDLHDRYRRLFPIAAAPDRDVRAEHAAIADAVAARDAERATAALRAHIHRTGETLQAALAAAAGTTPGQG